MPNHNSVAPASVEQIRANTQRRSKYSREWPDTRDAQIAEVDMRRRAYLSLGYLQDEIKTLGLFEALDSSGQVTAETTRLSRDIAFICDVDAASIASDALQVSPVDPKDEVTKKAAKSVWSRSKVDQERLRWSTNLVVDGEIGLETMFRADGKAVIISHPFEAYYCRYDATGTMMTEVCIQTQVVMPAIYDDKGDELQAETEMLYQKIITPKEYKVWIGGAYHEELSGPNLLGVIPFSRITYRDVKDGEFPLWAGYGYGDALATVDSFITQLRTLGTRHANPIMVGTNVIVDNESHLQEAGRTISIPDGAKLEWMEADLKAVDSLLKTSVEVRQRCIETLPEFLFVDAGAGASGTALSYRAQAFVAKIEPIRQKFYTALARQTAYAVVLDLKQTLGYDPDVDLIVVQGGPAIPQDIATLAKLYLEIWTAGVLSDSDLITHLQSMGIVRKDMSPAEYLAEIKAAKQPQTNI